MLQSYRTLRQGKEMSHPVLTGLAEKYGKTVAQLLGRWCVQQGTQHSATNPPPPPPPWTGIEMKRRPSLWEAEGWWVKVRPGCTGLAVL